MISRIFNMRQMGRGEFLNAILDGDQIASAQLGAFDRSIISNGTTTTVQWVAARQPPPHVKAAMSAELDNAVSDINKGKRMTITGASYLGEQFRSRLADVKKQIASASDEMNAAMGELSDTASQASEAAKQVKAEAADLRAALGTVSNNPPV